MCEGHLVKIYAGFQWQQYGSTSHKISDIGSGEGLWFSLPMPRMILQYDRPIPRFQPPAEHLANQYKSQSCFNNFKIKLNSFQPATSQPVFIISQYRVGIFISHS